MKHQVLYFRVTSIPNVKLDVIIDDKIKVIYDCVIKITKLLNNFCFFIYLNNIIKIRGGLVFVWIIN